MVRSKKVNQMKDTPDQSMADEKTTKIKLGFEYLRHDRKRKTVTISLFMVLLAIVAILAKIGVADLILEAVKRWLDTF
jgi:hypothetical protein